MELLVLQVRPLLLLTTQENRGRFATCSHKRKQATPPSKEAQWSFVVSYHNQFSLLLFLEFSMMLLFSLVCAARLV
ncbi:hypothetical protein Bca4012_003106 [Brassica carinata]|uniref:Uncharacterized protein n=1 Tax=Brassica oleracea var. oleracea TaxID=109376 RepID=A0A0D3B7Z3_BRAOL